MKNIYQSMKACHVICIAVILFIALVFRMTPAASAGSDKITICFYSSETNINNFKSLKMEFDSYLSKFGAYEFQPFSERDLFEQHIKTGKGEQILFLSSWHYSKIYKNYSLKPYLVGMRDGKNYQKRILVATPKFPNIKAIKDGPVASASNIQHTHSVLEEIMGEKKTADSIRILTVPKDVDALMSVGFEMAKSALITENALNDLKMLDPLLYEKMKILAEGKPSLLLILAVPESLSQHVETIIKIVKDMPDNPDGMNIIKMLDLDGWKTVESSDKLKLEG